MKHLLLKSLLLLALMWAPITPSFASEVIGNLSSSGGSGGTGQQNTGVPQPQTEPTSTPNNGNLSGNVSEDVGSSSQNGDGVKSEGEVLGEQTIAASSSPTPLPQGNSQETQKTPERIPESEGFTTAQAPEENRVSYENLPVPQTREVSPAFSQLSATNWFYILSLLALLGIVTAYIYKHDKELAKSTHINF